MDYNSFLKPEVLLKYSFWWSECRLLFGAVALLLGGRPLMLFMLGPVVAGGFSLAMFVLSVVWIVSGLASLYLLYRWWASGMTVLGGKDYMDLAAFFVMTLSGLNLGVAGLTGNNIGMTISSWYVVFVIVSLVYLWVAWYLYSRTHGDSAKLFQ